MKIEKTKDGKTNLVELDTNMFNAIKTILKAADESCFNEQSEYGVYYSNDRFVATLGEEEREALKEICNKL